MKKKFIIAVVFNGMYDVKQLMPYTGEMYDTEQMAEALIAKLLEASKADEVKIYCILPCYIKEV